MLKKVFAALAFFIITFIALAMAFYGFWARPPYHVVTAIVAFGLLLGGVQSKLVKFLGWEIKPRRRARSELEKRSGIPE
jgi:hypothetical protein